MPGRWSPTQTHDPPEAADPAEAADLEKTAEGGSFAALVPARYLQVTTFGRDGRPVPARVPGTAADGRAYFGAWRWSGTVKRLRHTCAVQVAPCGVLGVCYGPPLEAAARLLPAGEAGPAAAELTRKYPARRRPLTGWLHRSRRPTMLYYELQPADPDDDADTDLPDLPAPGQRGDQTGSRAARGSQGARPCQVRRTRVTDHGAGSIACLWPAPAPMKPARQPGILRPPTSPDSDPADQCRVKD